MVDIDPTRMYANGLSATDVSNAMNLQALILPAGTAKVGDREYFVRMNSSPPGTSINLARAVRIDSHRLRDDPIAAAFSSDG